MLTISEWVAECIAARKCTTFECFTLYWEKIHPNQPCKSDAICKAATKYNAAVANRRPTTQILVDYAECKRCYEIWEKSQHVIPPRAVKASRWADQWNHQPYRLVDPEPALTVITRRGSDGVFRPFALVR